MSIHTCVEARAGHQAGCLPPLITLFCLETRFLTELEAKNLYYPSYHESYQYSSISVLQDWSHRLTWPNQAFYMGAGDFNSGPHAYRIRALAYSCISQDSNNI